MQPVSFECYNESNPKSSTWEHPMPDFSIDPNNPQGEFVVKNPSQEASTVDKDAPTHMYNHITQHKLTPFSALSMYPENIVFQDQEQNENIILLVRRHFVTNVPWITTSLILIILIPFILPLAALIIPFLHISLFAQTALILFGYIVLYGYVLINFSIWYFNVTLITNMRIIDVDITGILFRNVAETKLNLVQDVSYTQIGVIRSFFDYGDILIQTAGEFLNFNIDRAPNPAEIIQIIGELIGKERRV